MTAVDYSELSVEKAKAFNRAAVAAGRCEVRQGDAVRLDFPDETFDAVVSNCVYQSIPGDRQRYLLETLRTLEKGGTFALHDIFSKSKYGDMRAFVKKLRDMGCRQVEMIDTTNGLFMKRSEAARTALSGSALPTGRK